jgi:hypothetical protein
VTHAATEKVATGWTENVDRLAKITKRKKV